MFTQDNRDNVAKENVKNIRPIEKYWHFTYRGNDYAIFKFGFAPPPFSSPEPTIVLACGWDRELWLDPIF